MKIMLVDDEFSIKRLIQSLIEDAGYDFAYAEDGQVALDIIEDEQPDLVIMDVMMPRLDGFATCRQLRERGYTMPVIFLSAKGDIVDKGVGFQAGGDDYMVKPFDPSELMMHIEAQLRRAAMSSNASSQQKQSRILNIGRFHFDSKQFRATKDGKEIPLTPIEFKIMFTLASNPSITLSKEQLVESAWGKEFVGETSSLAVFIKKLREKVEDDPSEPSIIQTVWGIGYRFEPEG